MSARLQDSPEREPGSKPAVIAVYWFSQTGQLRESLEHFLEPFVDAGCEIRWHEITPTDDYPFPWSVARFFGIFPAAADPGATVGIDIGAANDASDDAVDLVLIAHQVWYLNPSIPMRSLVIRNPERVRELPVVQFIACRNMWVSAAASMREALTAAGASHLGVIAATDTANQLVSLLTTLRWLLLGRREASFGLRAAGVPEAENRRLRELGARVVEAGASAGDRIAAQLPEILVREDAARENAAMIAPDIVAGKAFRFAAGKIRRYTRPGGIDEKAALTAFVVALGSGIVLGLPVAAVGRAVFRRRVDAALAGHLRRTLFTADAVRRKERL